MPVTGCRFTNKQLATAKDLLLHFFMYRLKKSLGQHFLRDENISRKIVATLQQQNFHQLLEVGSGAGALTKYFLQIEGIDFKTVEVDDEKIQFLLNEFPSLGNKLIAKDFLEMEKPFEGKFTVIGKFSL